MKCLGLFTAISLCVIASVTGCGIPPVYVPLKSVGEELSLCCPDESDVERYRFIWERSFHEPVILRLERKGETSKLIIKVVELGNPSYVPGRRVVHYEERIIQPHEWALFVDLLNEASFWSLPRMKEPPLTVRDGAYWTLEAAIKGRHHFVKRHSYLLHNSIEDGAFQHACLYLIILSRLNLEKIY